MRQLGWRPGAVHVAVWWFALAEVQLARPHEPRRQVPGRAIAFLLTLQGRRGSGTSGHASLGVQ